MKLNCCSLVSYIYLIACCCISLTKGQLDDAMPNVSAILENTNILNEIPTDELTKNIATEAAATTSTNTTTTSTEAPSTTTTNTSTAAPSTTTNTSTEAPSTTTTTISTTTELPINVTSSISSSTEINRSATNQDILPIRKENQKQPEKPATCAQREKAAIQPTPTSSSRLRKCCPLGENLDVYRENQSDSMCDTATYDFEPNIISAELYDNCIEDLEIVTTLPYMIGNACNSSMNFSSFQYDDLEDMLYVLQDGSLLIVDMYGNDTYTVEKNYCLDRDKTGHYVAFTCITDVDSHLARGQIITVATLMLISIPCLLLISYLHMNLRLLRNLHGLSLSLMSLCLAAGYFVHSVVHLYGIPTVSFYGYVIQFCILSYFFWYFCICCNVILNIWFKLPHCIQLNKAWTSVNFGVYCVFAFGPPAILVTLTAQVGLPGMPSYFMQGLTESIRESQRYFIPPVSTILALSFVIMVISFFGFQRIKTHGYLRAENDEPSNNINLRQFDQQKYEDVKKDAKCISLLGIIMIVTWLLEIVTFYSPGPEGYLLLCDMINGLQGVFVLLIFLVVRRRRTIILRWWYDRGSHNIEGTELQTVCSNEQTKSLS